MRIVPRSLESTKYGETKDTLKFGLPILGIVAITLFTAFFFGLWTSTDQLAGYMQGVCSASGGFHLYTRNERNPAGYGTLYNPYWQGSQFLSITIGFGRFQYALAKGIDVCWDLVVGRGGQILLTLLAYPVVRRSLFSCMERTPVEVPLYTSIAFEKVSFTTLRTISRYIFSGPGRRKEPKGARHSSGLRYLGFCYTVAYLLVFPTLVSVMTGYQADWIPYMERPNNHALVKFSDLETPPLVVVDGDRIGLSKNHVVLESDQAFEALLSYGGTVGAWHSFPYIARRTPICLAAIYFTKTSLNKNWASSVHLERNSHCNITWDAGSHSWTRSHITFNGKTWHLSEPPLTVAVQTGWVGLGSTQYLSIDRVPLSSDYLQGKGSCQPSAHYVWGFSSILLFIFCALSVLFAAVLASLHYESIWSSKIGRWKYKLNFYCDAVDLVYGLHDNYFGDALRDMSAEAIQNQCADKRISLETLDLPLPWKHERHQVPLATTTAPPGPLGRAANNVREWFLASPSVDFMNSYFAGREVLEKRQWKQQLLQRASDDSLKEAGRPG